MSLFDYVKSLKSFFHKDEIIDDLRINIKEFKDDISKLIKTSSEEIYVFGIHDPNFKSLNDMFMGRVGDKASSNVFATLNKHSHVILKNMEWVKDTLQDSLSTSTLSDGLSAKKAVLIRTSEQFSFLVDYTSKLLNYYFISEDANNENVLSPAQLKDIETGIVEYYKAFNTIADENFITDVNKIPSLVITGHSGDENPALAIVNPNEVDPFNTTSLNNFIGNPIYHLRTLKVSYQAEKYKLLQERKKLLEYRLMLLKDKKSNEHSPALEKKVRDMQSYISDLEYKLKKLEED